jgi:hypothetical protein
MFLKLRKWLSRITKAHEGQMFCGEYYDYLYSIKATQEFVRGFYDRAFGDKQKEFMCLWKPEVELKRNLELILVVLDKWVNDEYTSAEEFKSREQLLEAYRLLGKCLPEMWD